MAEPEPVDARPIRLELSPAEAELVRAALRLILSAEDDPETIAELKALIARLPPPAG